MNRIIKLFWSDDSEQLIETNANDKQVEKIIKDLRKKMPDDYNVDDFIDGLTSLGFIANIIEAEAFNF